jgi:hypothetical protein
MTRYTRHYEEIDAALLARDLARAQARDAEDFGNVVPFPRPAPDARRPVPRTEDGLVDFRRMNRIAMQGLAICATAAAVGIAIGAGLVWGLLAIAQLVGNAAALTGWAG